MVLSTLVVNTLTAQGPIIFMKMGQQESGEIDSVFVPMWLQSYNSNYQWNDWWSLNYTQALEVLNN